MSKIIKAPFARKETNAEKLLIGFEHSFSLKEEKAHEKQADYSRLLKEAEMIKQKAAEEAEAMIQSAQLKHQNNLNQIEKEQANWEKQREQLIKQAQEQGYEQGLTLGKQEGLAQYKQTIQEANDVLVAAKNDVQKQIDASEEIILKLGLKVAEKILGKCLSDQPSDLVHLVKRSVREFREYNQIQIFVHPSTYKFIVEQKDELIHLTKKDIDLAIYPDSELVETSCIIESPFGRIDASVDSQLQEMRTQLLNLLEGE